MSKTVVLVAAAIVAVACSLPSSEDDWVEKLQETFSSGQPEAFPEATAGIAAAKTCYVHPSDISCTTGGAGRNWRRVLTGLIDNSESGLDRCARTCSRWYSSDSFIVECPHVDRNGKAKAFCGCQSTSSRTTTAITKTDVAKPGKVDEALCRGSQKDKTFWYFNEHLPDGRSSICTGDTSGKYVTSGYAMGAADVGSVYKTTKEACPATMDTDANTATPVPAPVPVPAPTPAGCTFRNLVLEKAAQDAGFCTKRCNGRAHGGADFGSWTKDFRRGPARNEKCALAKCEWCICSQCPECDAYTRSTTKRKADCSGS